MDADLISYETMLATRDASTWAFWGMVASFCSVFTTLLAAWIALKTINSWKRQARSQELKNFSLAVYNFQLSLIRCPDIEKGKHLSLEELKLLDLSYDSLGAVYEASIMTHETAVRSQTSIIYSKVDDIQKAYSEGDITRDEAVDKVVKIRMTDPLLSSSY
ncbi:hypothetical protein [Serratia fonticola]|uniref:hypothetical protein n=1 Tax=Serratia fonticola TaxID=47917 RepID=UPI0021787106|nr:hypothetical protein [Serratia fonticola]CAI2004782.1 Uncharacterised protein [Serratia fonticola]